MRHPWRIGTRNGAGEHSRLTVHRITSCCWRRLISPNLAITLPLAVVTWTTLGVEPQPGLELGVTASIVIGGPKPHLPGLTLTWRFHRNDDGIGELGTLRLEP